MLFRVIQNTRGFVFTKPFSDSLLKISSDFFCHFNKSYKFLAALQEKADPSGLYALYVTKGAGHRGTLTQKDFEDLLLFKYYFIFDNLGIKFY